MPPNEVPMHGPARRSVWFYIGVVILTLTWGPFLLGFAAVLTWGMILLPIVMVIWFGPYFLLHYLLWGRRLSEQFAPPFADGENAGRTESPQRAQKRLNALRMLGTAIGVLCCVVYYLWLWGLWR